MVGIFSKCQCLLIKTFSIGSMSSGRLYANLTSKVGWEGFPSYAEAFVNIFLERFLVEATPLILGCGACL